MLIASEHERLFLECYCASRWHHRRHCTERRLRYVAVFWAALNQGNLLVSIYASGGIGTKAQWRVEKLIRGCLHASERHVAAWCLAGTTQ